MSKIKIIQFETLKQLPRLKRGTTHIIILDVSKKSFLLDKPHTLSCSERTKAASFRFETDRIRFILCRSSLRQILSHELNMTPESIQLRLSAMGKPELVPPDKGHTRLHFNVSHSEEIALIALSYENNLGIDVEYVKDVPDRNQLATLFFAPKELEQYRTFPESASLRAFYLCWTGNEAFVKATGEGLSRPLDSFSLSFCNPTTPGILSIDDPSLPPASHWKLDFISPAPNYIGACVQYVGPRATQAHTTQYREKAHVD